VRTNAGEVWGAEEGTGPAMNMAELRCPRSRAEKVG